MSIALSLFLPVLFGIGWLVIQLAPSVAEGAHTRQDAARLLSLALMLGLLVNYAVVLIAGSLVIAFLIAAALAAGGWFFALRKTGTLRAVLGLGRLAWVVLLVLAVLFALLMLFLPAAEWDARSIWLFHGKMIFFNDRALNLAGGWDQPFASFSHTGYPELGPILFAQFATLAGFWNEYFPKAGLLALLLPAVIGLFAFVRKPGTSGVYLLIMTVFFLGGWLWNGYMDGYLALYAAVACLFLGRWITGNDRRDGIAGIAGLAVTASLKNEGDLVILVALISLAVIVLLRDRSLRPLANLISGRTWSLAASAFLGPIAWMAIKKLWHLPGDMPSSPTDLHLIAERLGQGAAGAIATALFVKAEGAKAAGIAAVSIVAALTVKRRVPVAAWFLLLTAALYGTAMFWIYLTTNADLNWHLGTSAGRTTLPVIELLAAAAFACLFALEDPGGPAPRAGRRPSR